MLTRRGRAVRAAATAICAALLVMGTVWGADDHFPLGPMRMFATRGSPSGTVKVVSFEGVTADGDTVALRPEMLGLRPAEVEGQMRRLRHNPYLLRHLATAYGRLNRTYPRLIEVRLVAAVHTLRGRRPISSDTRVIASWRRP